MFVFNSVRSFTNMVLFAVLLILSSAVTHAQTSRVKDIADFEGVRSNILIGYGLVVGLAGTGDAANSIPFTRQTLINMLERLGVNSKSVENQLKTKNIAAVMVTAEMPAYARQGSRLDVTVSSLGDAQSLEGGMLIASPLIGADGETYAVAQGALSIGGFTVNEGGNSVTQNHTTAGRIADGAIVERETGHELAGSDNLRILLRNPDFTTAMRLSRVINDSFGEPVAKAVDNGSVDVAIPVALQNNMVPIIQRIENLRVQPDQPARIVVDEKTGTIVMGEGVRISNVAISHANLTVRITEMPQISQPGAFGGGDTIVVPQTTIEVDEEGGKFQIVETGISLADVVDGLNSLGVKPRDIVSILQSIKAAGALQADIKLM